MKTKLQQQVCDTVRRHRMFVAGDRVGVGVSGGADSVGLLLLLEELRSTFGITLLVLHFNHQLRGADADADERFVAELAAARGLEFLSARQDVAAKARREGMNLEEAARRLRYEFFGGAVSSGRATRVAVGHTLNDQAETVLAHLLRGTGHAGLAGIYPVLGHIVRPLLEARRQALREYLTARGQGWREDQTNLDTARLRSRIRLTLLPHLERDFQPAVAEHLSELARLARAEESFWTALLDDRFHALVTETTAGLSIRIRDLLLPLALAPTATAPQALPALTRRLVRRIAEALKGDRRQLAAQHVEQVIRLATETTSGHSLHLPAGIVVEHSFDRLIFSRQPAGTASPAPQETPADEVAYEYVVELAPEGSAAIAVREIGRRYRLKVVDWSLEARETKILKGALDAALVRPPLVLRNWRPGDAYRPRGSRSVRKLKRLFLDLRIAARERASWPVLTSVGRLVWARGLPPAADFAAGAGTRAALVIDEEVL